MIPISIIEETIDMWLKERDGSIEVKRKDCTSLASAIASAFGEHDVMHNQGYAMSNKVLDAIYERATRALADPADGDVMALTDICNIIEGHAQQPDSSTGKRIIDNWLSEVAKHNDTIYDNLPGLAEHIDRALNHVTKWLHRAADVIARGQDDEMAAFLGDFHREFPDEAPKS